jgi:hypothetical protein
MVMRKATIEMLNDRLSRLEIDLRKRCKEGIICDMRLANFKFDDKIYENMARKDGILLKRRVKLILMLILEFPSILST